MPKPNEQTQIDFIVDCLRKGEQRGKILAKFGKKWQSTSARTFDRRLKIAEAHAQAEQQRIQAQAEQEVGKEIEARKSKIMTAIERQEYLTKLITGEIEIPYTEIKWDANQKKFVTIKFVELAPHTARISAIAELNKMDGSYAAAKTEVSFTEKPKIITPGDGS